MIYLEFKNEIKNEREKKNKVVPVISFYELIDIVRVFGFKNEAEKAFFFKDMEDKIFL